MTELVDRIAKAILEEAFDQMEEIEATVYARAALAAMREYLADQYVMDWPVIVDEALK